MLFEEYERIITKGKKVDWHGTEVPEDLLTPIVLAYTANIIETINKYESMAVDKSPKNPYIYTLWSNIIESPYRLNGDFYLMKKREIEEKMKHKPVKTRKKEVSVEEEVVVKRQTKNSSLIFGNKK